MARLNHPGGLPMKRRILPLLIGLLIGALAAIASIPPHNPTPDEATTLIQNP